MNLMMTTDRIQRAQIPPQAVEGDGNDAAM
jgi:hypothetical protein